MAKKYNDQDGVWRTIGGRRVFIKNGQSLSDAMKESGKFKKTSDVTREEYQTKKAKLDKERAKEDSKKASELLKDRTAEPEEAKDLNELEGKHIEERKPVKEYTSDFHLEAEVNDFDKAQEYLTSDDMTQYIPEELQGAVSKVEWTLDDESSGHVSVQTTRDLTDDEKAKLQDWIDGQNSDGLGEGFEQQEFAESYYNPYTGDGPYTYREAESEIERMYDDMDPSEYSEYISESAIEAGMETWMEDHDMDHIEDDETYEEARQDILDDPESYLEWEDIDDAKNEAMAGDDQYNLDSWYNMSSLKRTNDGFKETELKSESLDDTVQRVSKQFEEDYNNGKVGERLQAIDAQERYDRQYDKYKENGMSDEKIKDMLGERPTTGLESESGKTYKVDTTKLDGEYHNLPERTPEEQASDERYANAKAMYKLTGDEKYKKEYQDEIEKSTERIRQKVEAGKQYDVSELEQGKPYEIDMGNGIKKTAIFMGKDEDGNNAFYDGEGVSGAFAFSDKFMKERVKVSDNKDDDKFMELHNQIKKETAPKKEMKNNPYATNNKGGSDDNSSEFAREARDYWDNKNLEYKESHDGKEDEMATSFRDRWDRELKNREYGEKKAKEQKLGSWEINEEGKKEYKERELGDNERGYWTKENGQRVYKENPNYKGTDQSSRENGLNSKEDYEHDLKWFEDMDKKYKPEGGLEANEDYQSLKEQYESAFKTKWNGPAKEETAKEHKNVFRRSDAEIDDAIQTFNDFKQYETFSNDEWNYADQKRRDKLAGDAIRNYLADNHITRGEMLDLADVMENENHNTEASLVEKIYDEIHNTKGRNDWIKNAYEEYKEKHPKSKLSLADFTKKNKK